MSATAFQNNISVNEIILTKTPDIKGYLKQELSQAKVQELKWKLKINRPSLPTLSSSNSKANKNRRKTESDLDLNIDNYNINTMEKEILEYSNKKLKKHKKKCKKKNCSRFENKRHQQSEVDVSSDSKVQSKGLKPYKTSENKHKKNKDENIFNKKSSSMNSNNCSNKQEATSKKPPRNAFSVMMEARNHVIGSNINGKDKPKDSDIENNIDAQVETKIKLKTRKKMLEKWAERKGSKKRKFDEEMRENYVKTALEKRAKRLKNMLENPAKNKLEMDENVSTCKNLRTRPTRTVYMHGISSECDSDFDVKNKKKDVKLAPLFLKRSDCIKQSKEVEDPALVAARQKFLQSGMPEECIKLIYRQKELENYEYTIFPTISHVTQESIELANSTTSKNINLFFKTKLNININNILKNNLVLGLFTNAKKSTVSKLPTVERKQFSNYTNIIKEMKKTNTKFPITKTFRKLIKKNSKKSKDSDIQTKFNHYSQTWSEKYKPYCSDDIIGNTKCVNELKQWLSIWLVSRERKLLKEKQDSKKYKYDFVLDFDEFDDSQNNPLTKVNTVVLVGPCGSGKTSTVYALANELNFNVIEINASSQRSGKKILNDIHEATQSRNFCENLELQNSLVDDAKFSLILIEDIDIVFSIADDGFLNAVSNIIQSGKRPVVITSSDLFSDITQKYISQNKTLLFHPLLNKNIIPWFQIVCTLEGLWPTETDVKKIFNLNQGDVRKTLNYLQFLTLGGFPGDELASENCPSRLSLSNLVELNSNCLFNAYWNLANLLKLPELKINECKVDEVTKSDLPHVLEKLVDLHENLAISDVAYTKNYCDIDSDPVKSIWKSQYTKLSDSLSTSNTEESCCWQSRTLTRNWTYYLNEKSVNRVNVNRKSNQDVTWGRFSTNQIRFKQKLQETYHNLLDGVSLTAYLGPRNLGTDYFPTLRQISQTEKYREATNNKRSNRFCNYLKSLDIRCTDLQLEMLFHTFP